MVISQKIQNQSPHHIGLLDPDLGAGLLKSQVLTEGQAGFLFYIEWFMRHSCIHRLRPFLESFSLPKKPAPEEAGTMRGEVPLSRHSFLG